MKLFKFEKGARMTKKSFLIIFIAMLIAVNSNSESFKISGRVVDETNKPLKGASIKVKGTSKSTVVKDALGKFKFTISGKNAVINVSLKGKESKEISVTKDSVDMLIVLKENVDKSEDSIILHAKRVVINRKTEGFAAISDEAMSKPLKSVRLEKLADDVVRSADGKDFNGILPDSKLRPGAVLEIMDRPGAESKNMESKFRSGILTAGEVNDFTKWNLWTDISKNALGEYQSLWKFTPQERYTVLFQTNSKFPLYGAKVVLKDGNNIIWESVTDNTGKAELWNNAFNTISQVSNNLSIELNYAGKIFKINNPKIFHDGINFVFSDMICKAPLEADIAFVVDATSSMQDEINYLKADLNNIIKGIKDSMPNIDFNLGCVFYRDIHDEYITKHNEMSNDIEKTIAYIQANNASGGGDIPEAVHSGLNAAINQLQWRDNSAAKVIFLILDAPPHTDKYVIDSLKILIQTASKKGIRIVPVTCSGIDKSAEYIMRAIALFTNGTYTFLTDDSGIGNPHIKPTTDKYEVETFNALLRRLIYQYLSVPKCDIVNNNLPLDTTKVEVVTGVAKVAGKVDSSNVESSNQNPENNPDKLSIKCYPNPTSGILNIETFGKIEELFISDVSGKLMTRTEVKNQNTITLNLSDYPNGTYYALCMYNTDKILKGKFIIIH